jgi:hypothetical protein
MFRSARSLLLAVAFVCGSAQAITVVVGSNPSGVSLSNAFPSGTTFSDAIAFSLTSSAAVSTFAFSQWDTPTEGLRNLRISLLQGSTLVGSAGPSTVFPPSPPVPAFTNVSFADVLAPGSYLVTLSGNVQPGGGSYLWGLTSTVAAVIPEPAGWMLLTAGLVLLGFITHRRGRFGASGK